MTTPSYDYWRKALAGEKPKMYVDDPQPGFYRQGIYEKEPNKARKRIGWQPVAIYWAALRLNAMIGSRQESNIDRLNELWSYCAGNPISEETYRAVAERGEPWPDEHETVPSIPVANSSAVFVGTDFANGKDKTMTVEIKDGVVQDMYEGTPEEKIAREIDEAAKQLAKFATIESDEQSSKARSLQQRFLDLRSQASKHYEDANRPLLDAQKKLRTTWFPLRDKTDEASSKLRASMARWEDVKRAAAANAASKQDYVSNVPPPSAQIRGGAGRAASVTLQKFITVTDQDAVYEQFKKAPEIAELLASMALKAVRAGVEVKGVTVEEKSVVR